MIVKTFEEILNEEFNKEENLYLHSGESDDIKDFCIKLMKLVRSQTLIEAAEKADVDWNISDERAARYHIQDGGYFRDLDIDCYVLTESILGLDKNSIEI